MLLAIAFIHILQFKKLILFTWEMSFAFIGLFIGFYLEFGITNVDIFYELCGQGNMYVVAPITVKGMFVGCMFGMLVAGSSKVSWAKLVCLNLGMLVGMLIFERLKSDVNVVNAQLQMFAHLTLMIIAGHIFHMLYESSIYYTKLKLQCFDSFLLKRKQNNINK
ncbi:hypothetical protein J3L16_10735 [Alteromonas sp. 5E99-2]|uniref:hypothetical protein n=1 Tax=Alteromonas sp. 5E99-2 TaxID=2817683 RepID=UPI001A983245|nr:hypothetical protein [Alteromonas sp. 5E99-2]MBO1256159.1 hypothetical protein [Alteromonas sp. 5E99-2]